MPTTQGLFDYDPRTAGSATGNMYGSGGGTADSSKTIKELATLQPEVTLPPWMTTNPDALSSELMKTYGQIPSLMSAAPIRRGYNKAIDTTMGMGGQIASNAAREGIARAGQTGGQVNSSMLKAQAMLPVYDTTSKLQAEKAAAITEVRKNQADLSAKVATSLATMRSTYLATLAQTYLNKQTATNSFITDQMKIQLAAKGQEDTAKNQAEATRLQALQLALQSIKEQKQSGGAYFTDNQGGFVSGKRSLYDLETGSSSSDVMNELLSYGH